MGNPFQVYLEPYCLKCYKDPKKYFLPEPLGRQWAVRNLWPDAKCDKCGEPIEAPGYKLLEKEG